MSLDRKTLLDVFDPVLHDPVEEPSLKHAGGEPWPKKKWAEFDQKTREAVLKELWMSRHSYDEFGSNYYHGYGGAHSQDIMGAIDAALVLLHEAGKRKSRKRK